jgi:UDP-N-acetylmuramoyl-L-alanyl-D-glutamate--2,6-diaminopimelate ligase
MSMLVLLSELANLISVSRLDGDGSVSLSGIQTDHRKVKKGNLFVCIPGLVHDGHDYAALAADQGAAALVVEHDVDIPLPKLLVKNSRQAMGLIASHFYQYPSRSLKLIGITGTNGKTTTAFLLDRILSDAGHATGVMGTIHTKIGDQLIPAERTTQEALDLQRTLRQMVEQKIEYCAMEVSSHSLELGRVKGCRFRSAIFTNLTQDHLDYHETMERYRDAKALLFARMGNDYQEDPKWSQFAVLNSDDPVSERYASLTAAQTITYGIDHEADVRALDIHCGMKGTTFHLHTFAGDAKVTLKLIGKFNIYNTLAAITAALLENIPLSNIVSSVQAIEPVDGRMQTVDEGQPFLVLVDYAHTPDGLENALRSVKEFATGRVITVFGCGGDRDRTKRPIMGSIAASYSDYIIVTSDNPRSEDPELILREIEAGIIAEGYPQERYTLKADRGEAIRQAIAEAGLQDVVLIAGKGHEAYQILKDRTIDFDDRMVAAEAIHRLK